MPDQNFSKHERLKSRKKIHELFDTGYVIHHYPFKINWQYETEISCSNPAKIAIGVSKRSLKKAVDRNRIKRKIREVYRKNKRWFYNELQTIDQNINFIVIYTSGDDIEYSKIEEELIYALKKMIKHINK
ncbi:MAG: ribonuclease P protein component [Bacteroidales bacterium]